MNQFIIQEVIRFFQPYFCISAESLYQGEVTAEHFIVDKAAPVITWTGKTYILHGETPDLTCFTVQPSLCPVEASLFRVGEDSSLYPVQASPVTDNRSYLVRMTVEEGNNWYAAQAEQLLPVNDIVLSAETLSMVSGQVLGAAAQTVGELGALTWESSDSTVVSVDQQGRLTAVSEGQATVTLQSGHCAASCTVTVIASPDGVMRIPSAMKTICSEAFAGCAAQIILLPQGIQNIMDGAFTDSESLIQVICPQGTFTMAPGALGTSSNAVIVCPEGSPLETVCRNGHIPYVIGIDTGY